MAIYEFLAVYTTVFLVTSLALFNRPWSDHHADLPHLCAHLDWSYDPANSTLSVGFYAALPTSPGWVAWGINPTGSGMIGAQAIVLSLDPRGFVFARVYNLSSYQSITQIDRIRAGILDLNATHSFGLMRLWAKIALPEGKKTVNHVWQAGRSTSDGMPDVHDMHDPNLKSFGVLNLTQAKRSTFLRWAEEMVRALNFEKACTLGRKSIWNEYITFHNIAAANYYSLMLTIIVLSVEAKEEKKSRAYWKHFEAMEEKKYGAYWKLFHDSVMFAPFILLLIGVTKVIGLLVATKSNFAFGFWAIGFVASGLLLVVFLAVFYLIA